MQMTPLREEVISNYCHAFAALCDKSELDKAIRHKQTEIIMLTELTKNYIDENARKQCDVLDLMDWWAIHQLQWQKMRWV